MQNDYATLLADGVDVRDLVDDTPIRSEHAAVYRAPADWAFNLHSYLLHDDTRFWAMWSSGEADEEGAGQVARYATSDDGLTWSAAQVLAPAPPRVDGQGTATCIARGLFVVKDTLTALVAYIDELEVGKRWFNLRLARFEHDGRAWVDRGIMLDDAINNYPPRMHAGRWIMTARDAVRHMSIARADDDAASRWDISDLPLEQPDQQMSEPSWYVAADGSLHMLFRDGRGGGALFRSVSTDDGVTWSPPVKTNYPDATSKNFSGRLRDGRYFLLSNPGPGRRRLVMTFSDDGWIFHSPKVICVGDRDMRHAGRAKPDRSVQYPHAIEHDGALWVIYSVNKEDIDLVRIALDDLLP